MTRSEAYRLLGLKPGATEGEIRKRYKMLALKVHPDINPSPDANEQFILLTNAVELLLSPDMPVYHHELNNERSRKSRNDSPEEQKRRMDEARMRFEQQKRQKQYENARYFQQLTSGRRWLFFRSITVVGCLLSLALILDAFLPTHYEKDELVSFSKSDYNGILHEKITILELKEMGNYFAETERGIWLSTYPEVLVKKTWLLHTPVSFFSTDDFQLMQTDFDFHLGSVRWIAAGLLLLPLLTRLRRRRDLTYVFLYQFSFWGVGLLEIYLLISQHRLEHLLTLGFL